MNKCVVVSIPIFKVECPSQSFDRVYEFLSVRPGFEMVFTPLYCELPIQKVHDMYRDEKMEGNFHKC